MEYNIVFSILCARISTRGIVYGFGTFWHIQPNSRATSHRLKELGVDQEMYHHGEISQGTLTPVST